LAVYAIRIPGMGQCHSWISEIWWPIPGMLVPPNGSIYFFGMA